MEIFSMAGNVVHVEIKEDKDGKSRGLGTAAFQHAMEAVQAICILTAHFSVVTFSIKYKYAMD